MIVPTLPRNSVSDCSSAEDSSDDENYVYEDEEPVQKKDDSVDELTDKFDDVIYIARKPTRISEQKDSTARLQRPYRRPGNNQNIHLIVSSANQRYGSQSGGTLIELPNVAAHQNIPYENTIFYQNIPVNPPIQQEIPQNIPDINQLNQETQRKNEIENFLNEIDCNSNDPFFQNTLTETNKLPEITVLKTTDVETVLENKQNEINANIFESTQTFETNDFNNTEINETIINGITIQLPETPDSSSRSSSCDDNTDNINTLWNLVGSSNVCTIESTYADYPFISSGRAGTLREPRQSFSTNSTPSYNSSIEYSPCPSLEEHNRDARRLSMEQNYNFALNIVDDNIPTTVNEAPLDVPCISDSAKKNLKKLVNMKPEVKKTDWVFMQKRTVPELIHCIRRLLDIKQVLHLEVRLYAALEAFLKKATLEQQKELFESEPSILECIAVKNERELTMYIAEIMLNRNFKIKKTDANGRTLLHRIIQRSGRYENILSDLLSLRNENNSTTFDVNDRDSEDLTVIHYAIYNHINKLETLELLLKNRADMLTTIHSSGQTYLHYAIQNKCDKKILESLIREAQNQGVVYSLINRTDKRGNTALQLVYNRNDISIMEKEKIIKLLMDTNKERTHYNIAPM